MMSVATEIIHRTNSEVIQFFAMSDSNNDSNKAEKKRYVLLPPIMSEMLIHR
jgi:hypothetical protein